MTILAIITIALLGWYVFFYFKKPEIFGPKYESVEKFSKYVPKEILIETNPQVIGNLSRVEPDGTLYSIIELNSNKSLDENFEFYKKDLVNNRWKIQESRNEPRIKNFTALKPGARLFINVYYNEFTNKNVVAIHHFDYKSFNPNIAPNK